MLIRSLAVIFTGKPSQRLDASGKMVSSVEMGRPVMPGMPVEVDDEQALRMIDAGTAQPEGEEAVARVAAHRAERAAQAPAPAAAVVEHDRGRPRAQALGELLGSVG